MVVMLYTSYFAKLKQLPKTIVPIAICGKSPDWYDGLQYKKLAPNWGFFQEWKKSHDNQFYVERFNAEVLAGLDPTVVYNELVALAGSDEIALLCYESPEKFCHRHLVRNWFMVAGFPIKEF